MEQQITKTVLSVARKNEAIMREETGLAASVEDEEIVRYTKEVLKEVMKERAKKSHKCQNNIYVEFNI
jgi:hypothetical protein